MDPYGLETDSGEGCLLVIVFILVPIIIFGLVFNNIMNNSKKIDTQTIESVCYIKKLEYKESETYVNTSVISKITSQTIVSEPERYNVLVVLGDNEYTINNKKLYLYLQSSNKVNTDIDCKVSIIKYKHSTETKIKSIGGIDV